MVTRPSSEWSSSTSAMRLWASRNAHSAAWMGVAASKVRTGRSRSWAVVAVSQARESRTCTTPIGYWSLPLTTNRRCPLSCERTWMCSTVASAATPLISAGGRTTCRSGAVSRSSAVMSWLRRCGTSVLLYSSPSMW
jgi:hypothetical protein